MTEIFRVVAKYQALVASTLRSIGEGRNLLVEQLPFSFKKAADILAIQAELSSKGNSYKTDGFKIIRITHVKGGYMELTSYDKGPQRVVRITMDGETFHHKISEDVDDWDVLYDIIVSH